MRNLRSLCFLFAMVFVQAATAAVPSDPGEFTNYVQGLFEKQLAGYTFEQPEPMTLKGSGPEGKTTGDITLERIHGYCAANPNAAEAAVAHYIKASLTLIDPEPVSLRPDMIRLIVRREDYMQDAIARMGPGPRAAFFRPLAPGLVLVPVIDLPASLRYVGDSDLAELKMTDAEVFRAGENNFRKSVAPLSKAARTPPKRGLGYIREEYAPTRLAFHADWARLAKKLGGKLVVMVPASDLVMFTKNVDRYALDALRTIGSDTGREADRPLSDTLLRWTETGWQKVEP